MGVRTTVSNQPNIFDELFAEMGLINIANNSNRDIFYQLTKTDAHRALLGIDAKFLSKPIRQLISGCFIGFLVFSSLLHAAEIKLAIADKDKLLIPSEVNIDENSQIFSSHIITIATSCANFHWINENSVGGMPLMAGLAPTYFVLQISWQMR
jgi:hypothetical protein